MTISEILDKHNSDKGTSLHNYGAVYEFVMNKYKYKPCKILEIGVYKGGSLRAWAEYLPLATIVGIDLNPDAGSIGSNIHIEVGNQEDCAFLGSVSEKYGPFDIIIDDGSHLPKSQQISFHALWPALKPNGVYFIEDLEVSYVVPYYQSENYCPTIDFFKSLATINAIRRCNGTAPWIMFAGEMIAIFKNQ